MGESGLGQPVGLQGEDVNPWAGSSPVPMVLIKLQRGSPAGSLNNRLVRSWSKIQLANNTPFKSAVGILSKSNHVLNLRKKTHVSQNRYCPDPSLWLSESLGNSFFKS